MRKKTFWAFIFLFILSFIPWEAGFFPVSSLDAASKKLPEKQKDDSPEAEQKMTDFSFSGYGARGKKTWDVKGNSADIFPDIIRLTNVYANVYGEEENVYLVGDKGSYNKATGKMHLEDNVVITTQTGGKLTTDSLDWDSVTKKVTTPDPVNIEKQNMKAIARGLEGEPNLKKVELKEEVQVELKEENPDNSQPAKEPTVITCDGPLEIDYGQEIAIFNNNVRVNQNEQGQIYADKMTAYFDFKNKKILQIKSVGNVKIVKGENVSYSDEALYLSQDKRIILTGKPRLVIYSEEKIGDASFGN